MSPGAIAGSAKLKKIIHLIPYDGIGGVEQAAASSEDARRGDLYLRRLFVFEDIHEQSLRAATWNLLSMWRAAERLRREDPNLVILSLWRAVLVGGLARLQGFRAPMILFLHNTRDAHLLDWLVTRCALPFVDAIWADSKTTLQKRLSIPRGTPTRVISFLVENRRPVRKTAPPTPHFAFWGRLAHQKNLARALAIFDKVQRRFPNASFNIIGPDGGLRSEIEAEIRKRGLQDRVHLLGPQGREEIESVAAQASFYLQTSFYEGMALSVMEAMQAGLVPVVTPVGEISNYTRNGTNAVWVQSGSKGEDAAVEEICALLQHPQRWRKMQNAALVCWSKQPIYSYDLMSAAEQVLSSCTISGRKSK